ncbi:MAG TPA: trypsin-like peptidase domain-containing protein [Candidatus Brocadiia bacterium]|nr:trypsin-like peptidase domain-containing protein [Candidatus Brocadiia bacterium]
MKRFVLAAVAAAAMAGAAQAGVEKVLLRSGASVTADVIKERPDSLVLDLGYDVVTIPLAQVVKREAATEQEGEADKGRESDFYETRRQEPASVKENVETWGPGVVMVQSAQGLGSGFIVNKDGYVVTNFHVIEGEQELTVTLFERRERGFARRRIEGVQIVSVNPFLDLALLKFDPPQGLELTTLALGDADETRAGQPVFALGNPLGLDRSVSEGIISTDKRDFGGLVFLQTTAPINPGNSGGPLFNMRGEVIGVTNMKAGWLTEGLSFAIPMNYVKDFLRNRDAFAFDKNHPNTGFHYFRPPVVDSAAGNK